MHHGKGAFNELQTTLGWTLAIGGLLLVPELSHLMTPASQIFYDWMHTFFQGGIFNVHVIEFVKELKALRINPSTIYEYLKLWHWPDWVGSNTGVEAFSASRMKSSLKADMFKAQASEGRSLCPVLAKFAMSALVTSANPHVAKHGTCFLLLADLVGLIEASSRRIVNPDKLHEATHVYLQSFKDLYGPQRMTFKFHMSVHFADFLARWDMLPNCTSTERKHKKFRKHANQITVLKHFDNSLMRELTVQHLSDLCVTDHFVENVGLVHGSPPTKSMLRLLQQSFGECHIFQTSRKVRINHREKVARGDVVFFQDNGVTRAGSVRFNVSVQWFGSQGAEALSFVDVFQQAAATKGFSQWKTTGASMCLPSASICRACVWSESFGVVTILHTDT
jgi:hypothetical protein